MLDISFRWLPRNLGSPTIQDWASRWKGDLQSYQKAKESTNDIEQSIITDIPKWRWAISKFKTGHHRCVFMVSAAPG